jgi:hypothetical protein
VKALESDTKHKIDSILKPLLAGEKAPAFYGAWTVEKILRHFPNGAEINREIFEAVTSAIQTLVRKANRQIRDTKSAFGLPTAGGLLVIVNDGGSAWPIARRSRLFGSPANTPGRG